MQDAAGLESELIGAVTAAEDLDSLERARVAALGRNGKLTRLMRGLGDMPVDERKATASALNALKDRLDEAIEARKAALEAADLEAHLAMDRVDVTLPVRPEAEGRVHPVSQVMDEIIAIFADMDFAVAEGPDIEDDFHNFTALNIPPEHPARQMHDTFYFPEKEDGQRMLLRTHTSPVQIRHMQAVPPPHRIIVPGRTDDASGHSQKAASEEGHFLQALHWRRS